jgi:glycosyltransferase involved in cell wall biosynthesis
MQKILFISCAENISGAEISLSEILRNINRKQFSIHLILPQKSELFLRIPEDTSIRLLPVNHLGYKSIFNIVEWINVLIASFKIVRYAIKMNINIVYCNTSKTLFYCFLLKLVTTIKIVCHCRDVESSVMRFLINTISNKIICVSEFIRQQINSPASKTIVCYNGIDASRLLANKVDNSNLSNKKVFTIANIGQAVQWKRQDTFIDIAASILKRTNKVHFLMTIYNLSSEDSDYISEIHKKIAQLKLENYFTITGFQSNVSQILSSVDLLIHTAYNEPFGRIVAEAQAMAIPIIASDQGGPSEIIINNESGFLITDLNIDAIVEKTIYLMNKPAIRTQFGIKGRKTVEEKFDSIIQIKKTEEILKSV